ncbi:hypothetical protein hrd7_19070 [Leptolinea sp. HRD-7]|nr:hypothetical protein hrd7_19070 [Leptolinea sp. HRD-7]
MDAITVLIAESAGKVWISLTHNWPYLLVSVVIAAALKLYTNQAKISAFLIRNKKAGVVTATAAAVGTPLCSCGTTAVVLGMMASMIPWAPIVAFMVASPLSSPEGIVYSAGLFGWPFAIYYFIMSIFLGLAGGTAAEFFERHGWLKNQNRLNTFKPAVQEEPVSNLVNGNTGLFRSPELAFAAAPACDCGPSNIETMVDRTPEKNATTGDLCSCSKFEPQEAYEKDSSISSCGCRSSDTQLSKEAATLKRFFVEVFSASRQLLIMFLGFAFIGYFLNGLIPEAWIKVLFGSGNLYSVPLAATIGIPFYINSEGSLPLVSSLIQGGMNPGAAMAFLITGAGTSLGAVTGMLTIARWRVVAIVVTTLWVGSIIAGYGFNFLIALM